MAAGGTPGNVDLGPGRLYYAPLGTAEPASCSAVLPSAWQAIGYTEEGTSVDIEQTSEAVDVAEELDPIGYEQTRRTTKLSLAMAETTKKRLALAMGSGAAEVDNTAAYEPPDAGTQVGVMLVWDSEDTPGSTNRRWIFRKCTPSGTTTLQNRKAPQKRTIPVTFDCVKPDASTKAWKVFPNASGQV